MNVFRRLSSRGLAALVVALMGVVALASVLVVTAVGGSSASPATEPLDQAIHDAISGPAVTGVSAQLTFSNHLFDGSGLPSIVSSGLLSGATGQLSVDSNGHARLDLTTALGDITVLCDGTTLTLFNASSNTAYQLTLPAPPAQAGAPTASTVPSIAEIDSALTALGQVADVSQATSTTVAGQSAYTVSVTPKSAGGLLGSASLSFDANTGMPLDVSVYAKGSSSPVLELSVTKITYGAVKVDTTLPSGVNVVPLTLPSTGAKTPFTQPVTGLGPVAQALPFTLVAPDSVSGLARNQVRLVGSRQNAGALVTYGTGLGTIAVIEHPTPAGSSAGPSGLLDLLPTVALGTTSGHQLVTPLGTIVTFDRGGVSYIVAGSVDQADAAAAATTLASQ